MSLFANYCREKGMIVVENERGFMSANVHDGVCFIDNFYVVPEYRGTRVALRLTLEIIRLAEEKGCTLFAAEIYKIDPLYHYILRLHKHFGMEVTEDTPYKTVTYKRINNARPQSAIA